MKLPKIEIKLVQIIWYSVAVGMFDFAYKLQLHYNKYL